MIFKFSRLNTKIVTFCLFFVFFIAQVQGESNEEWWPHPIWGAGDEAGASNWITPDKILSSLKLVKQGKVYELGHVYEMGMPVPVNRPYEMKLIGPFGPFGTNRQVVHSETLFTEIGQVGTQFDGLGHVGKVVTSADGSEKLVFYNGFTEEEIYSENGLRRLGIEKIKPIITRGILIDIAKYKSDEIMQGVYEVTLRDVHGALKAQGMNTDLEDGDAVIFRFGAKWDETQYAPGPGVGLEVVQWLIEENISLIGSDKAGEFIPEAGAEEVYPMHQELMMKNGIFNLESMNLGSISDDKVYEFLFIFTPVRFKGATGSPGRPIAIY